MKEYNVFIGNTSKDGIYHYKLKNGRLIKKYATNDFERCTYLANSKKYLYSVIETSDIKNNKNGYIISYKKDNNQLTNIDKTSSYGSGPCHIEVNENKDMLLISNYIDGYLSIIKANSDGTLGKNIYSVVENKEKSHLHCVKKSKDGNFFFVSDLGGNVIIAYEIKDEEIKEVSRIKLKENSEPRHIAISKKKIYVVTEKSCELYVLTFINKKLRISEIVSILPNNIEKLKNYTGCAIKISEDFKYLYITVRGHDSISIYKINNKKVKMIQNVSCNGKLPWDIEIDKLGKYILVANHDSNNISIFRRNKITGKIKYKSKENINLPTCIIIE